MYLIISLFLLITFIIFFIKFKSKPKTSINKIKGSLGEDEIYALLSQKIKGKKLLFKNIYIPKNNSETTEIDILLVSPKGIFVFESKNYSGYILGNIDSYNWIQSFGKGKNNKFYNPILQNKNHIKALENLLNLKNNKLYYSFIVFGKNSTLHENIKGKFKELPNTKIVSIKDLSKEINYINNLYSFKITDYQIKKINSLLKPFENASAKTKIMHVKNLKKHYG